MQYDVATPIPSATVIAVKRILKRPTEMLKQSVIGNRLRSALLLIRSGHFNVLLRALSHRLLYTRLNYGLRLALSERVPCPRSEHSYVVRPASQKEARTVLSLEERNLSAEAARERIRRIEILDQDIPTCYVAIHPNGKPCHVQWLIEPAENQRIQELFHGQFPWLKSDEMLIEFAFTHEVYRGCGIMPIVTWHLIELARNRGANRAITFLPHLNAVSLKGLSSMGFKPYTLRRSKVVFGFRSVSFNPVPPDSS